MTAAIACMALIGAFASSAEAQPKWSEKTILKFDSPVLIPGTTLQPGSYVFKLADSRSNRNLMQVFTEDGQKLVTTAMTVPARRMEPNGDVVLKFADTKGSNPVALKGFFYPGSLYGHEFVYSDAEAKKIAQDTHTLVLSQDIEGSDFEKGTLHHMDDQGRSTAWTPNPDVTTDWTVWIAEWRAAAPANTNAGTRQQAPSSTATTTGQSGQQAGQMTAGQSGRTTAGQSGQMTGQAGQTTAGQAGQMTGTSGRNMTGTATRETAGAATTASEHAAAIQRLIDRALTGSGATVSIDRATLEQIRDHAAAIAQSSSNK